MTDRVCRVLVVEDDPLVLATVSMQIRRAGFEVAVAADGAAAIRACDQSGPDIALVDFCLPDISGIELLRRLRLDRNLPCVLLTGNDDPSVPGQAVAAGAALVLRKPVDTAKLESALHSLLQARRAIVP